MCPYVQFPANRVCEHIVDRGVHRRNIINSRDAWSKHLQHLRLVRHPHHSQAHQIPQLQLDRTCSAVYVYVCVCKESWEQASGRVAPMAEKSRQDGTARTSAQTVRNSCLNDALIRCLAFTSWHMRSRIVALHSWYSFTTSKKCCIGKAAGNIVHRRTC